MQAALEIFQSGVNLGASWNTPSTRATMSGARDGRPLLELPISSITTRRNPFLCAGLIGPLIFLTKF